MSDGCADRRERLRLMRHATKQWEGDRGGRQRTGRDDRAAPADRAETSSLAKHLRFVAAPQFPALLRWPAYFVDRYLDAKHGPGLAGLRTDGLKNPARAGGCHW